MMSADTQNLLARILLALAEGERKVEDARKEISNEDAYDIQAIFKTLDNNGDNYITPKDIQKYLNSFELEVNFMEVKLLILFYDQDHDFSLTYGEIFKMIHPGKEYPKIPKYKNEDELNERVNRKLYNLMEKEIVMARTLLALLEDIKHKRDFNIHSAFHALKYYACITGDSINIFLKQCGMRPTAGDIRAIVRRLDINKDEIIDFCEFHAFLGYPDCTFCCPCFPCANCGVKYCDECLQDIPCYLLGCDHKGMDSKMRCTSAEHNPGTGGGVSSLIGSILPSRSMRKTKPISGEGEDEENENKYLSSMRGKGKYGMGKNQMNQMGVGNTQNGQFFNNGRNGFNKLGMSPEQYNLLQGLTDPEKLNKFMTISGIIDRQNSEGINITKNLSLTLSPIRDFDPKEWGCRDCPCNIHSNPNVSCDCCVCDLCPDKSKNKDEQTGKQKQKIFPRVSLYSYTYSYDPDNSGPNQSFLSTTAELNSLTNMNSPKKGNIYFDKEENKYKTMVNSSDEEQENEYMNKINNIRNKIDQLYNNKNKSGQFNNPPNSMIYSDEMSNMKTYSDNNERQNIENNININQNIEENITEEKRKEFFKKRIAKLQKMNRNEEEENIINTEKK